MFSVSENYFVTPIVKSASQQTSSQWIWIPNFDIMYRKKKKLPQQIIYSGKPHVCLVFTQEKSFFPFFLEWSTAAEIRSTEERLLFNLTTQPGLCAPRGDDPYKSVSIYAEAAMILLLEKILFEGTCWGLTEQPDSRGGGMGWYCRCQIYFLVSAVGCGTVGLYSFTLSLPIWKRSLWIRTANLSSCLRVDVSQSILKSVPRPSPSLSLFS